MAAKIVRQPNRLALLGVPTSAAALSAGHEVAPSSLRAAGIIARLQSIGYEITDLGDDPVQLFKPDEETPRARNLPSVVAMLEHLKPRVEHAVKLGALPLILGGDCSIALATVAGVRRYFRHVGLIYMDRDADLNTPATTRSGSLDGMVVSHLIGTGAAELVRFWGEPPLVREPDLALFGVQRLDPAEEELLSRSPLRRYLAVDVQRMGPAAAQLAVERIHGLSSEFVLHLDVDVIADFEATDYPGSGGLSLDDVRAALKVFAVQKHLAALEVAGYHPGKDTDGKGASLILDLLEEALKLRLAALQGETPQSAPASASSASTVAAPEESGKAVPPADVPPAEVPLAEVPPSGESGDRGAPGPVSGEALSSDSVEPSTGVSEEHVSSIDATPMDPASPDQTEAPGRTDEPSS